MMNDLQKLKQRCLGTESKKDTSKICKTIFEHIFHYNKKFFNHLLWVVLVD